MTRSRVAGWLRHQASWAWRPAAIAAASRAFSIALVLVLNGVRRQPAANPFALWDGLWYLGIARDGYHGDPIRFHPTLGTAWRDIAFFPAWPATMKVGWLAASPFDLRLATVATILANLLFVLGAVLAWRVLADRVSRAAATAGIALLAFAPPAYAFSMVYGESLFLVFAAGSLLARRSILRAPLTAGAMLVRIAGGALVLAALVEAVLARGRERRAAIAAVAGGVVAFGAWWLFTAWLTQSPTGFLLGSLGWNRDAGPVLQTLHAFTEPSWQQAGWLAFTILAVASAIPLVRRDRELGVFTLAAVLLFLLPGSALHSWPRYTLAGFAAFAVLGESIHARWGRAGVAIATVAFALGQVAFAWMTITSTTIAP